MTLFFFELGIILLMIIMIEERLIQQFTKYLAIVFCDSIIICNLMEPVIFFPKVDVPSLSKNLLFVSVPFQVLFDIPEGSYLFELLD